MQRSSSSKVIATTVLAMTIFSLGSSAHAFTGMASFYKTGRKTANGEKFLPMGMTCAHRKFPFGTKLKVTNLRTGRWVQVRVNDRGPFIRGRVLDLSLGAAKVIGLSGAGVAKISYIVLD